VPIALDGKRVGSPAPQHIAKQLDPLRESCADNNPVWCHGDAAGAANVFGESDPENLKPTRVRIAKVARRRHT